MFITDVQMAGIPAVEDSDAGRMVKDPIVSVIVITFNHGEFISEAIDSILRQKTEFQYEILIGEDKSTDNTLDVCRAYQKRYPDRIRLISADANVGMHRNIARLWRRCRGRYIAFCEGDDYWCDDLKLAKQVEFLNKNSAYSMCGSYTDKIKREEGKGWQVVGRQGPARIQNRYDIVDLISAYTFHTSSILVRKEWIRFPSWFWRVYCADRPLYILCAEKGPVGFITECMSVYRFHEGGAWSPRRELDKAEKGIELFEYIDEYLYYCHHKLIKRTVGKIIWSYAAECLLSGDLQTGRKLFRLSLEYTLPTLPVASDMVVKTFIRLYFPGIYNLLKSGSSPDSL